MSEKSDYNDDLIVEFNGLEEEKKNTFINTLLQNITYPFNVCLYSDTTTNSDSDSDSDSDSKCYILNNEKEIKEVFLTKFLKPNDKIKIKNGKSINGKSIKQILLENGLSETDLIKTEKFPMGGRKKNKQKTTRRRRTRRSRRSSRRHRRTRRR